MTPYDSVPYPTGAFPQTHPAATETLARLRGMDPAPVEACRVLELGCGSGGNLIPMAFQYPESTFIGVDLSLNAIADAKRTAEALCLRNVTFEHRDIMDLQEDLGSFDYIIVHGVYSWVPPAVRTRIMELFARHLAPQGIAYVSYNCLPQGHMRNIARDIMLFHTRGLTDAAQKTSQAVAILRFIAEATDERELYGFMLRDLLRSVEARKPEVLFHDDLNADAVPFLFHQVMDAAGAQGLQFLCEAASPSRLAGHMEPMNQFLDRFPDDAIVAREQYRDFLTGRGFRTTLLCREGLPLQHRVEPTQIEPFFIASQLRSSSGPIDPASGDVVSFELAGEPFLSTDHRLSKAALVILEERWPQALSFEELVSAALDRLGAAAASVGANLLEERKALASVLYQAFTSAGVVVRKRPFPFASTISRTPEASLLARRQAAAGSQVTNLLHGTVTLEDPVTRHFVQLLDGTRTVDELVNDLRSTVGANAPSPSGDVPIPGGGLITREAVEQNLRHVARLVLLVA